MNSKPFTKNQFLATVLIFVSLVVVVGIGYRKLKPSSSISNSPALPEVKYGILHLDNGQRSITYPLIFDDVQIVDAGRTVYLGSENFQGYRVSMDVRETALGEAEIEKEKFLAFGWVSEGSRRTPNGYEGELLSDDPYSHPEANTQNCGFAYSYMVPLVHKEDVLTVSFRTDVQRSPNVPTHCEFKEPQYHYFKDIVDKIILGVYPSN